MPAGRRVCHSWGVAIAIVAVVLLAPRTASAGCGDHVRIIDKSQVPTESGGLPVYKPSGRNQELPHLPCHGPDCSANPSVPAMPMSVPAGGSPDTKSFAFPELEVLKEGTGSRWHGRDEGPQREISRTNPIFHPPRG